MPEWLISLGFVLVVAAVALRTMMMMRASDAAPPNLAAPYGRRLVRAYRTAYPASRLPLLTVVVFAVGVASLLVGLWWRLSH